VGKELDVCLCESECIPWRVCVCVWKGGIGGELKEQARWRVAVACVEQSLIHEIPQ
jgi:hypothetical protein